MKFLLLLVSLCISGITNANNYYFSSSSGDDSRSSLQAQNPSTPWKTISKLNSFFSSLNAGDNVYFQRGDIFYGSITINKSGTSSNPITLSAYGTGADPVISGFTAITAWTNLSGNIWESTGTASTLSTCNIISINGVFYAKGRMPKSGYWAIPSTDGSTTITDGSHLNTSVVSAGADVVVRELMYEVNRHTVSSVSGNTITFTSGSIPSGWGYFVQNDVKVCTVQNEWCYNAATKKVSIYSTVSPTNVQVPSIEEAVNLNGKDYISFTNLDIQGYNTTGINTNSRTGVKVQNCNFSFIGTDAIYGYPNSSALSVTGSTFTDCGSRAIHGGSSNNAYISGNTLLRIGHFAGMGSDGDDSYTGIICNGDNSEVSYNSITNVGYCGIRWDGNSTVIKNNFVNTTNYVKDDGGGIYCYPVQFGNTPHTQLTRTVRDNIVLNSVGAPAGSPYGNQGMGIYMDGQSPNIRVIHNSVSGGKLGYFVNGGHDIYLDSNASYNFESGLYLLKIGGPIDNETVTHNNFVAATAGSSSCGNGQYPANYQPGAASMPASFVASNNIYARPLDQTNGWIFRDFGSNACNTLAQWQSATGQDAGSANSPVVTTNANDLRFEYNETSASKIISLGANYIDMKAVLYPGTITLAPYSSAVLIKNGAGNVTPTANAGPDLAITLPTSTANLSGSGVDPDGTIASYLWTEISGPGTVTFSPVNNPITIVSGLISGTYKFELKVTDNSGATDTDTMQVTVNAAGNQSPIANAGPDQNITLPTNAVSLNGTGTDPDGVIFSYSWTQISGPAAGTITNPSNNTTTVTGLVQGVYQFLLTVTDNSAASSTDIMQVTVSSSGTNTAYGGTPWPIPGTIELEDFDDGGQNIAYYDNTTENIGGIYRPLESVDIENSTEGTPNIGWTEADEWMKYTVNITTAGTYSLQARVSSQNIGTSLRVEMDGIAIATINVPNTGGYQSWQTVTIPGIILSAGIKVMRVYFITGGYNLNYITFSSTPINQPPAAIAGVDQTITLPVNSISLNGSGNDPDGTIIAYQWAKISGPANGTITNATSATTSVTGLVQGVYTFELKVTDNSGATDTDTIQVTVNAANQLPTANAGIDQNIALPVNSISLNGSGTDPDGIISAYLWRKISGPTNGTITNISSAVTTATGLVQGTYKFELKVTDNSGATDTDTMQVTVNAANQPPIANAGLDQNITLPVNSISLNGSGTDPDGIISAYLWRKISGPANGTITNATSATTSVTGLVQSVYTFELKVTDNSGATDTDTIQVTVNAANQLPTANAGIDQNITLPVNSISLNGSGTDPDGIISAYLWRKISGPTNGTITNTSSAVTTATGLVQGTYKFELKVTDNSGATDTDTMQVTVNAANQPPIANAGLDQNITLPVNSISLNGSGTDPDGIISAYLWRKISGPTNGTITNTISATTSATGLVQGIYKFELKVTDNSGATDTDTMQVTVNPAVPPANQPPTANAGLDQNITLPVNTISLNGSGTDPDGIISAYLWRKISGPTNGTITNTISATTSATGLVQGIYKFELKVTDNSGATDTDTMQVTVNPAVPPANQPPTANAGLDQNITLPVNSVSLNGSGTDPDGIISAYLWRKISGPTNGTITNTISATTSATGLVQGIYKFELKVTDNSGATDTDTMQVTVNPAVPPANQPPTANAGLDQNITLPVNTISLNGSGTDPDGIISAYLWRKISGPTNGTITNTISATTSATGLVQGIYKFELKVTDNSGATDTDTMQVTVNPAVPPANQPPTANAGLDQNITLPVNTISLNGSGTDPDGIINTYEWRKISGPAGEAITNALSATTTVTGLAEGVYEFELKVTDNSGATDTDTMQVTVHAIIITPINQAPVAHAGTDTSIYLPDDGIILSGSGTDPDGYIVSYSWSVVSGGANLLTNSNSQIANLSNLQQGTYEVELTVTDNDGATGKDTIQVTVGASRLQAPAVDDIVIMGNPVSNILNARISSFYIDNRQATLALFDIRGVLVSKKEIIITQHTQLEKMDMSGFQGGTYYLKLNFTQRAAVVKEVVKL